MTPNRGRCVVRSFYVRIKRTSAEQEFPANRCIYNICNRRDVYASGTANVRNNVAECRDKRN